jgi:hypothetical protein
MWGGNDTDTPGWTGFPLLVAGAEGLLGVRGKGVCAGNYSDVGVGFQRGCEGLGVGKYEDC